MRATPTKEKAYCNIAARELGLDPAGHAGHFDDAILIETPLPWKRELYQEAGVLPQEAIDLMALWRQRYQESGHYGHRPLLIAPEEAHAQAGYRRVVYFERPTGLFARFDRREYLVPHEDLGLLLWSLFEAKATLPQFDAYRVQNDANGRDILVCTHGTIDIACAKFGYPLYRHLRDKFAGKQSHADLRVWRVSHFGGHVFAPTLIDMPTGHYWAYVGTEQADQIVQRDGDVAALRGHYRGWAGVDNGFAQAAECNAWQREGWAWFDYAKGGVIETQETPTQIDEGQEAQAAAVQISYERLDGTTGIYRARVERSHTIETIPSTGHETSNAYPQYTVTEILK